MAGLAVEGLATPWQRLDGKVVMVTGASSGIGLEFCISLAKAGCRIVAAARRIERLKSLCDEINQMDAGSSQNQQPISNQGTNFSTVRAVAVQLDVSADGKSVEEAVRKAWDAFGRIDALINNAGVRGNVRTPLDISEEEFVSTVRTNLVGTWLVSKYVGLRMRDAKTGGSIINISSISGINRGQLPGGIAYASSKSAVISMTKVMAQELGVHRIRVNVISPGLFPSEITQNLVKKDWIHNIAQRIVPLRDHGSTDPALTSLIRYLIHDSSEYVTGNSYIVDSGVTIPGVPIFSSL